MLKVWGRRNSSNVQKVMWAIGELKLPHERADIGGPFGGNRDAAYLAKNPNGLVPTIEDGDFVLWESNAIVRYLAAKHDLGGLCPSHLQERASADRWMDWQVSTLGAAIFPMFWNLVRTPADKRDMKAVEESRVKTGEALKILDAQLARADFVAGKRFTMGDIPVGIMAYRWFAFPIERPNLPALKAWYDRLAARPAFQEHVAAVGLT
ncbi:MAG: glutathione S-transferase [Alphaproteobacteria bacterium]|nr:glutathione S-transferase [Alphaproteobacteria bacterium]